MLLENDELLASIGSAQLHVTEVSPSQPSNADSPISVTESGIDIDVRPLFLKALYLIDVTELGMVTVVIAKH
jgi:hypothetical protein